MAYQNLLLDVSGGIATVTLNRPSVRNALSRDLVLELTDAFDAVAEGIGENVFAVVLAGAGRSFCAGGDIKSMQERRKESPAASRARLREAHVMLTRLAGLEVPVIAAIDGAAAGAGCNLALTCDLVLASPRARFIQSFVRIGLVPDYGGFFQLPRIVGIQRAKELVFTGRTVGADEAKALGMVCEILPTDGFDDAVRTFASRFTDASPEAIGLAKGVLNRTFGLDYGTVLELEADLQSIAKGTDYHRACVDRFLAKEPTLFDWDRARTEDR